MKKYGRLGHIFELYKNCVRRKKKTSYGLLRIQLLISLICNYPYVDFSFLLLIAVFSSNLNFCMNVNTSMFYPSIYFVNSSIHVEGVTVHL